MGNDYSTIWFDTFLVPIPATQTARELEFLARQLPQPRYQTLLDMCCGMGRHARELSGRGYSVIGVDSNGYALEQARTSDPLTRYTLGDMRALESFHDLDGVLLLWQSFGNFDSMTNEQIVQQIANALNPRGRFVLDIYNRSFFETRLGECRIENDARTIVETKSMQGNRLRVELDYGNAHDVYEWQIYYPDEISVLADRFGLNEILRCSNFDEYTPPARELPRMQFVFEKTT